MKKVLILSGSPRKGGNSDILCDEKEEYAHLTRQRVDPYAARIDRE